MVIIVTVWLGLNPGKWLVCIFAVAVLSNAIFRTFIVISKIHLSVALQKVRNQSHINPIAEELSQRLISDGYVIKDKVDVVFLSQIIEGFSRNIASNDKVPDSVNSLKPHI